MTEGLVIPALEIVVLDTDLPPEWRAEFDAWERAGDEARAQIDQWEQEGRS